MNRSIGAAAAAACALGLATSAHAITWMFPIEGSQEVPVVASPGSGMATVTYDTVTNQLDWDISWSGLTGAVTVMHFHGAAAPGINAGVQVDIGGISGTTSPSIGMTTISELQEADLLAGLWYVNIHTAMHPGGEIRGQVVPTPGALALLGLGGAIIVGRRRRP